jgi:EAL domain-containing protein (putative c-di-GMP-specific phosphodiesterase class I)
MPIHTRMSTSPWPHGGAPASSGHILPAGRGRVLLVDDDRLVAVGYERTLRAAGYAVESTNDGRDAVARFKLRPFDVIISDVRMPEMSGLELLRSIREHDLDVPVIIMTGSPDVESASEAIEHGAFRYLLKPVNTDELSDVVARAVRLHQVARFRREAMEQFHSRGRTLEDRASLEVRFASSLSSLWMAYQPIVSCSDRSLFAYEALVRTEEPTLRNPAHLFDAAERLDRLHELGQAIRRHVAATIPLLPPGNLVFVNVHPADLQDETLLAPESPLSAFASRIVLEITERAALGQISDLMTRVGRLRKMGYRIAVDDLGAGYAGLTSFAQLEPEIVKVDMSIIRGIERSATKQKMLASIISLCSDLHIDLIAEGIETPLERDAVLRLGGNLCQGYLFARPGKPFPAPNWD